MTNPFRPEYRQLSEAEEEQVEQIKDRALWLHTALGEINLHSDPAKARYVALAKTALEEAVMWATKAVTT